MTTASLGADWRHSSFYCPIRPAIHPQADLLERRAIAWLDEFGVYRDDLDRARGLDTRSAEFICRVCPNADQEGLLLFIEWIYWNFTMDDNRYDTGSAATRTADIVDFNCRLIRSVEASRTGLLGIDPLAPGTEDLANRIRAYATPVQFRRLIDALRHWLHGEAWQASNTERGIMPSVADFAVQRLGSIGMMIFAAFIEIANGIEIPGEQIYSLPVQAATEAIGLIVGWDNDILSYAKNSGQDVLEQNIINVLVHHKQCSVRQALTDAVAIRDRVMTLFLRLRKQISRDAGPELRRYLDDLGHFVRSTIEWSETAPRYAHPIGSTATSSMKSTWGVTFTDVPSDPSTEAPPIASIAWWWDQVDS